MTEQQSGLRFDIYERVHLQEGTVGIRELNDVELVPHIQVLTTEDQAVLKGNLRLTCGFVGETGEEDRTLEHSIPVEITLPLNRIQRVEDVSVDIENFDVDLLSPRSLNVTGVLSLQGVEVISTPAESWSEEEEVTFVNEAEPFRVEPAPAEPPAPAVPVAPVAPPVQAAPIAEPPVLADVAPPAPQPEAPAEAAAPETEISSVEVQQEQTVLTVVADPEEGTVISEEKKELKVAFGKKAEDAVEVKPYGIKSLLSKAGSLFQPDKRKEDALNQQLQAEEAKTENVEWKKLFLNGDAESRESREFRKLRMCIVQKEDTLESIAQRYQINPRELQLLNRLNDQDVSAGQVIYLPR